MCLIAYEKEEHEANMLNNSQGGLDVMSLWPHGVGCKHGKHGNHEVLMLDFVGWLWYFDNQPMVG